MGTNDADRRQAQLAAQRENRGRLAQVSTTFSTKGQGMIEFPGRVAFGMTFIEKPAISTGFEMDPDDLEYGAGEGSRGTGGGASGTDGAEDGANNGLPGPVCTGYVTEWDIDAKGNYVGAWCAVSVYFPEPIDPTLPVVIEHHFTFTAVGLKDVPNALDE